MNDAYSDVQTLECPKCKHTTLDDDWEWDEHNGTREWTCENCGSNCIKEISTRILGDVKL